MTDTLFIIPARGGSKGLPKKNILPINGKPMICYTIDAARGLTSDENICVSTDDLEIKEIVESYGLKVHFLRPADLATDTAGTRDVLLHAIDFYETKLGKTYKRICLLQPTSPLRKSKHIKEAIELWEDHLDMVVSVKESKANPYFNLFEEKEGGFLKKLKEGDYTRRQDAPKVWEYNGAIYIINIHELKYMQITGLKKVKKYIMSEENSLDIDDLWDFELAKIIIKIMHSAGQP
ncbi:acylneuraminate cytidylyltransferase family protein [Algoriphagus marincola]|uniref:Acylneuraminate cytidylyltransferase family protein n=1 Tax=Algoriphagus marincola TaxID=264027 RepID=A0ABS7N401_9BACT|nr:acylneuraminate cytidylyltransferase family protein [Algoriphagus marincola]